MNAANHTPGPWSCDYGDFSVFCSTGAEVASITRGNHDDGTAISDKEMEMNMRLVAAAPDLLAALREVRDALHECRRYVLIGDDNGFAAYRAGADAEGAAYAAIAKAEGREYAAEPVSGGLEAAFVMMAESILDDDDGIGESAYSSLLEFAGRLSPECARRLANRVDATDGGFYLPAAD
jgi:hypothetical protein